MKKLLLTTMFLLVSIGAWAQSGWTDPSNEYQSQTVVYAVVDCGDYDLYGVDVAPEVAAFVDGELRSVVSNYRQLETQDGAVKIYTLRVGGTDADQGKEISFKLYDPTSGLVYQLAVKGGAFIAWTGDATSVYPSNYYTLTATPAVSARLFNEEGDEVETLSLRVGDRISLTGWFVKFYDINENEIAVPDAVGTWTIGGPNAPYVEQISTSDGSIQIRAIAETPDFEGDGTPDYVESCIMYRTGYFDFFIPTQVLPAYVPVTSIAIDDVNEYWKGWGRMVLTDDVVIYNNNENWPTNPGVEIISSSNTAVATKVGSNALSFNGIGSSIIGVAAIEDPSITTTFSLNILSALNSLETGYESLEVDYIREGEGEEDMEMAPPIFNWVKDESGSPIIGNDIDESYTVTSSDPTVLRVDETDNGYSVISLKVGYAELTVTSKYDATKSLTYKVTVKQGVSNVNIIEVNGEDISQMPSAAVDVIVGKTITAKAIVNPENAYFEEFTMNFVDENWGTIENYNDYVEVLSSKVDGNVCNFEFRFKSIPDTQYFLQASADYDFLSSLVQLNVYNNVSEINVNMQSEYWISDGENVFDFECVVEPFDALDRSLIIESSNSDIAEVIVNNYGMFQLHAYTTGEVTFTFTSVSNPSVKVQATTVIKREPTGLRIVTIDGKPVNMEPTYREAISISVGQEVEAVAQVDPNQPTIESFIMQIVNANGAEMFGSDVLITKEPVLNEDGTQCSFTFTFVDVPQETAYVKAIVNDKYSDQVELDVVLHVTNITLSEDAMDLWIFSDELRYFEIGVSVYPDNATNKEYTVESSDENVVSVGDIMDGVCGFQTEGKGTATLTFTSVDNPTVFAKCTVTVKRKVESINIEGIDYEMYNDGQAYNAVLSVYPYDADFEMESLTVDVVNQNDNSSIPSNWQLIDVELADEADENGNIEVVLTPRSICDGLLLSFILDITEQEGSQNYVACEVEACIREKIILGAEWNWISLISGSFAVEGIAEQLVEARSKNELVFNDPSWGLFGELDMLDNTEAYKLYISPDAGTAEIVVPFEISHDGYVDSKQFVKGWNWVSYPYEYAYAISDIFNTGNFSEGDIILSKNGGFATHTNGNWEGSLEYLTPGEGYMMYVNKTPEEAMEMPNRYSLEQGYFEDRVARAPAFASVWEYNGNRFANTMAIIGKVDVEECESYTIGAFVGEECRGEGKFVNGKAYISVAGDPGDIITFRLYNMWTGEFTDLSTEIVFADMLGSAKNPIFMGKVDGTTGIVDINTIDANSIEAVYDISGRAVNEIKAGIYILQVRENGKLVTKKVCK